MSKITKGQSASAVSAVFERGINELNNEENSLLLDAIKDGEVVPDSEEMYRYVESKVKECLEIFKSQPVSDDMVKNFNEIADKLNDIEWDETDEFYDECIDELVKYFVEFADSLKEAQEKANYIEEN